MALMLEKWLADVTETPKSKTAAKTLVEELYSGLTSRGHSCWLDVRMGDRSRAAMQEGVERCVASIDLRLGFKA